MSKIIQNQYLPDHVTPPGETLLDTIQALGISQAELARRTGRPKKTINEIINGKAAITPETAFQLEHVLGVPAIFWNNRERAFREAIAAIEERKKRANWKAWADKFPHKELVKRGFIPKPKNKDDLVKGLLNFFGIISPDTWSESLSSIKVAFRASPATMNSLEVVAAWLRIGELRAREVECEQYNRGSFLKILKEVRSLTTHEPEGFYQPLIDLCAETGVVIVFVPELPGLKTSGAARWLTPYKALIQLNLRYKRNDSLWFSFFHEAGHILYHSKRETFIDDDDYTEIDEREKEANRFAADFLISSKEYKKFIEDHRNKYFSKRDVVAFAAQQGIHPGLVVGRLQHEERIPYSNMNDLIMSLKWT